MAVDQSAREPFVLGAQRVDGREVGVQVEHASDPVVDLHETFDVVAHDGQFER